MRFSLLGAMGRKRPEVDPLELFDNGEPGWFWDVQDLGTLWQDAARTVPAAVGDPVGGITDKSGNGVHAQAAGTDRPTLAFNAAIDRYYLLSAVGSNTRMTATCDFGELREMTVFAAFRNYDRNDLGTLLEMQDADAPGPSTLRIRQRVSGPSTLWDALARGENSEGAGANGVFTTTAPNDIILVSQHDLANDLSTIRVNGVDGIDGTGEAGANDFGLVDVNLFKANFRPTANLHLYGLLVRGALTPDTAAYEGYFNKAMGGDVLPPPSAPLFRPTQGIARELDGRMPWAAFGQPIAQHAFWQDVGCNVMGGWNPDVSSSPGYVYSDLSSFTPTHQAAAEAWDASAIARGFKLDRFPFTLARALADLEPGMREHICGWSVQDEPELTAFDIGPQLALMAEADPTGTIVRAVNFTATGVIYENDEVYEYTLEMGPWPYVQPSFDIYPVQQTVAGRTIVLMYRPNGQPYTSSHTAKGLQISRAETWDYGGVFEVSPLSSSPWCAYIATGGFTTDASGMVLRVPTPAEVRFQIADALVMGAAGIYFFPQRFEQFTPGGPHFFTSYNATPPDVKAQLIETIAYWRLLETEFATNLLINPANNRLWPAVYRYCPDTNPTGTQDTAASGHAYAAPPSDEYLPGPFYGSAREVDGVGTVYFITNAESAAHALTDAEWGFAAVNFAAWETLVFIEGDLANPVWSDIDGLLP